METAMRETSVKRAVEAARREMVAKFQETVSRAKENVEGLNDQPKEDMVDLAQIEGNLQFIGLLQSEEPPSPDDLVKQLTEQKTELEGAHEKFARLETELKEDLNVSLVSFDLVNSLINGEPVESAAANVGIRDFSDSNRGTPRIAELSLKKPDYRINQW